jgi:HlyD family secretion protein
LQAYRERAVLLRRDLAPTPGPHDKAAAGSDRIAAESPRDHRESRPHGTERSRVHVASQQHDQAALRPAGQTLTQSVARTATRLPAIVARNLAEAFVPSREREADHDVALQRHWRRGLTFIGVFGGVMCFWSVVATMSSAVIASGQFVVDGSAKKIQHPSGGIVGQLLVRDGDHVSEGDLLIRFDETITRANLQIIVRQMDELAGRKARLEAERDGRETLDAPPELIGRLSDPDVAHIVTAEQKLFQARRAARESQRAQLAKRIAQLQNEIRGLQSQKDANARETQIITEELKGVRDLFAKNLTPIMRINGLERQAVNLDGQKGQLAASIAQSEGKIAEIELQIMQIGEDLRSETQKELREVQGKIAELSERRVAAEDQLKRTELRAPSSGYVHQLAVHTVGGVITAAEPIMLIVPAKEELVLEARVMPQDRDQLHQGQKAVVRVNSSNHRNTPELNATLTRISADVSKDAGTAAPFYTVTVTIPKAELTRLRNVSVTAGMQAEVFIEVGSRSPLEYLLKPLTDQTSRAFRER